MELFCNKKIIHRRPAYRQAGGAEIAEKNGEEIEEFRFNNDIQ
jgi:hypothetical protein